MDAQKSIDHGHNRSIENTINRSIVGGSRTTLWRCLQEENITLSSYTDISDCDLDIVKRLQQDFPNACLVMNQGHLQSVGLSVQRCRVRQFVACNDPIHRNMCWHQVLSRRSSYSVPGPNSLWHIDGHHSLIRLRFVIHGGIDGYSRSIVYLQCITNNKAESVSHTFGKL